MIDSQTLVQLKAFARQDGAILALLWLMSLWFMFQTAAAFWGQLLALSTPVFIIWRLDVFRNKALDGTISFRRAFAYSCYVFFYASLLFALGQFLYFKFLDNGMFMKSITEALDILKPYYLQNGVSEADLETTVEVIKMMKPVELIFTFMMNNLLIGAIVSPVIAFLGKRKKTHKI